MASYLSTHTGLQHDTYVTKSEIIDLIYPVGSYYMSDNSTSPATLFGGTWTQIKDKFILAAGDTYAVNTTGGEVSHTHTTPATTTGGTALTIAQMPSHNHRGIFYLDGNSSFPMIAYPGWDGNVSGYRSLRTNDCSSGGGYEIQPPSQGGGQSHTHSQVATTTSSTSNMPPYLVAYIWKRTG